MEGPIEPGLEKCYILYLFGDSLSGESSSAHSCIVQCKLPASALLEGVLPRLCTWRAVASERTPRCLPVVRQLA